MWVVTNDSPKRAIVRPPPRYQRHIAWTMDVFFPVRHVKEKSTDMPWINKVVKKKKRRRMEVNITGRRGDQSCGRC